MMLAWSFSARTVDEIERLLRALGKHRYVREVDHRIHWTIDQTLADLPAFTPHARVFDLRRRNEKNLEPESRDPSLWRSASIEDIVTALRAFWIPGAEAERRKNRLRELIQNLGLPKSITNHSTHRPKNFRIPNSFSSIGSFIPSTNSMQIVIAERSKLWKKRKKK